MEPKQERRKQGCRRLQTTMDTQSQASMERLLELFHDFSKARRTEINVHQFTVFLYTRHQHTQMIRGSLAAQRQRLQLPRQGTQVQAPDPEDPARAVQGPACARPLSLCSRAQEPPLKAKCSWSLLCSKRRPHTAARHRARVAASAPARPNKATQIKISERESKITAHLQLHQRE